MSPVQLLRELLTSACCLAVIALVGEPEPLEEPEPDYLDLWARQQERAISAEKVTARSRSPRSGR